MSGSEDEGRASLPAADALRLLIRQRMGSDDSPTPPSSGKEGPLEISSGSGSEIQQLPVSRAALRELLREQMGSEVSTSPPSSVEADAAPGKGKHLGVLYVLLCV